MQKRICYTIFCLLTTIHTAWAQSDLQLWYTKPASKWTEALPIGNGRLGAMIYGGVAKDQIQFNEETLWSGKPRNVNNPNAHQYLTPIRNLLFQGKQKEAEELAQQHFMGLKTDAGDLKAWTEKMRNFDGVGSKVIRQKFNDSKWKTIKVPVYDGWETAGLANLDGAVWFRTSFEIDDQLLAQDLVLDLNRIYNADFTYINGVLIGSTVNNEPRIYEIPKNLLKKGSNVIAIQVLNYSGKGGILGFKDPTRAIGIYPAGKAVAAGISLNKNWKYLVQSVETPAIAEYQGSYQPFGDVFLNFDNQGPVTDYKRSLDLSQAVVTTSYKQNGVNYQRTYFASEPQQIIVMHFTADRVRALNFEATFGSVHLDHHLYKIDGKTIALTVKVKDGALKGEARLTATAQEGSIKVVNNAIKFSRATDVTLYLTAGTNFVNADDVSGDPVSASLKAIALRKNWNYDRIRSAHVKDYQNLFNRFSIKLGNPSYSNLPTDQRLAQFATVNDPSFLALFVQYGRYLLISSSRPGTQPTNLQGIWNDLLAPPWGSKYTTNINLQMNYWPASVLNLGNLNEPLYAKIDAILDKGSETAKAYYQASGSVLHHNTDLWNATAPINAANHGIWVTGAAWLCQHLWEHYQFTKDTTFLKEKAYPGMKQSAAFFVDFLITDPKTGWLISTPSNSPENGGLVAGPTMDHQIIRTLLKNCIKSAQILDVDQELVATWQEKLKQLAPNQIGKYGQLQEWLTDIDDTTNKHRHVSHLWGVYPGNDITWKDPKMMQAAKQSLLYRGDDATGWSLAWKINFWARFKEGEHAMQLIRLLLKPSTSGAGLYDNLFDAHPPFQIDGNFGAPAGIAELLLQSHEGFIDILPALPAAIPDGEVKGLCARGGFELDLVWRNGKLYTANLKSNKGGQCELRYGSQKLIIDAKPGNSYSINSEFRW